MNFQGGQHILFSRPSSQTGWTARSIRSAKSGNWNCSQAATSLPAIEMNGAVGLWVLFSQHWLFCDGWPGSFTKGEWGGRCSKEKRDYVPLNMFLNYSFAFSCTCGSAIVLLLPKNILPTILLATDPSLHCVTYSVLVFRTDPTSHQAKIVVVAQNCGYVLFQFLKCHSNQWTQLQYSSIHFCKLHWGTIKSS